MRGDSTRFTHAVARANDLVTIMLYRRKLTAAEDAELAALTEEIEALGEQAAAVHYGSAD
jgi:hypothetical protein